MKVVITQAQKDTVVREAQSRQNTTDLAYANARRRKEQLQRELSDLASEIPALESRAKTANDEYNVARTLGIGDEFDLPWGILDVALVIKRLKEKDYTPAWKRRPQPSLAPNLWVDHSDPKKFRYFADSRSGGRAHSAQWNAVKWKWDCNCESGAIRGWCWVTKGLDRGVRVDLSGQFYVIDEKGNSRTIARTAVR